MNIVRLAAAGAGKTWKICDEASKIAKGLNTKLVLLVTYTNRGIDSIRAELKEQNNGMIPQSVKVMTWYQFLLRELIKPYQTYITGINEIRSLDFSLEHKKNFCKSGNKGRYITRNGDVRSEEASNLVLLIDQNSKGLVFSRLEKIYSHIFFDEVQDMAGTDLSLLEELFKSRIKITCVGDNKQATFQTHTTTTNKKKSGKNIFDFFAELECQDMVRIERNLCTRRFNENICRFANKVYPNENNITTCMTEVTDHDGVFLISREDALRYFSVFHPQELRYSKKTVNICGDSAVNFGECKGQTYERCLIYPTKTMINFLKGEKFDAPEKYYVAVTRAKYSNAIVVDKMFNAVGFEPCEIEVDDGIIYAMKYVGE